MISPPILISIVRDEARKRIGIAPNQGAAKSRIIVVVNVFVVVIAVARGFIRLVVGWRRWVCWIREG